MERMHIHPFNNIKRKTLDRTLRIDRYMYRAKTSLDFDLKLIFNYMASTVNHLVGGSSPSWWC
jgi:hypothetical protein